MAVFRCSRCVVLIIALVVPFRAAVADDRLLESFTINKNGDCILLPVSIGEDSFAFIFDTGTVISCVDDTLQSKLEPTRYVIPTKSKTERLFQVPSARIGRSIPFRVNVRLMDLSVHRSATGHQVFGILGMDFLKRHVVSIDFNSGRLTFFKETLDPPGHVVTIRPDEFGRPTIPVRIGDDFKSHFMIDTGHVQPADGSLTKPTMDLLAKSGSAIFSKLPSVQILSSKVVTSQRCAVRSLSVAGFDHETALFNEHEDNMLGLGYLSRYKVVFDFPHNLLYLEKGAQFDRSLTFDSGGLLFSKSESSVEVRSAELDGNGHKAGIRRGDIILQVNGRDPVAITSFELSMIFAQPGSITLKVRSGYDGKVRSVVIANPQSSWKSNGVVRPPPHVVPASE